LWKDNKGASISEQTLSLTWKWQTGVMMLSNKNSVTYFAPPSVTNIFMTPIVT
jgi:hypothetical protein